MFRCPPLPFPSRNGSKAIEPRLKRFSHKTKERNDMFTETTLARALRVIYSGGIAAGFGLMALPAMAQDAAGNTAAPSMQRVEITGSAIKRTESETALP